MAWSFDETNDDVQLTDNAALTLPDADWSLGGLIKLDDNVGSFYQYFISWNVFATNDSIHIYFHEASEPEPNFIHLNIHDSDGTAFAIKGGTPGTSTSWQHVMVVRSGDDFTLYVDNVSIGTFNQPLFNAVNSTATFYIGSRNGDADRFTGADMAEWAKWDSALSSGDRADLTNLHRPNSISAQPVWYCSMVNTYTESIVPLTVTNNGSVEGTHPQMIGTNAQLMRNYQGMERMNGGFRR